MEGLWFFFGMFVIVVIIVVYLMTRDWLNKWWQEKASPVYDKLEMHRHIINGLEKESRINRDQIRGMEMRPEWEGEEYFVETLAELDNKVDVFAGTLDGLTGIMKELLDRIDKLQQRVELGTVNIIENTDSVKALEEECDDFSKVLHDFKVIQGDHIAWWSDHFSRDGVLNAGGELQAVITAGGSVVHKAYDNSSPTSTVLKSGTMVTITEFHKHNKLVWARIGNNEWIHGGWKAVDDKG